jgi:hypothetical protein
MPLKYDGSAFYLLVSCLTNVLNLKMEAKYFTETSVNFQRKSWRYIPADMTLQAPL